MVPCGIGVDKMLFEPFHLCFFIILCLATTRAVNPVCPTGCNNPCSACPICHVQLDFGGSRTSSFPLASFLPPAEEWVHLP